MFCFSILLSPTTKPRIFIVDLSIFISNSSIVLFFHGSRKKFNDFSVLSFSPEHRTNPCIVSINEYIDALFCKKQVSQLTIKRF